MGANSGSAYVFERQADGSWPQTAKLFASDGDSLDSFGYATAISGDVVAAGSLARRGCRGQRIGLGVRLRAPARRPVG